MSEPKKKKSVLKRLFELIQDINDWVEQTVGDDATRRAMLMDLGLSPDLPPGTPPANYPKHTLPGITQYREKEEPDHTAFLEAIEDLKTIYAAGRSFIKTYQENEGDARDAVIEEVTHRFFELMSVNYIRVNLPWVYWLAQPLGLLEEKLTTYAPGQTYPDRLASIFKDIGAHFKQIGGGLENDAEAEAWMDTLLAAPLGLAVILKENYIYYGWDTEPNTPTPQLEAISRRTVSLAYDNLESSFTLVPRTHGGPAVLLAFGGAYELDVPVWEGKALRIGMNASNAVDFLVRFDRFKAKGNATLPKLRFKLVEAPEQDEANTSGATSLLPNAGAEAAERWTIGSEKGTHLDIGPMSLGLELSEEGLGFSVAFADSALVIRDGDSFVIEALGSKDTRLPFHFGLGFKSGGNLYLEGGLDTGLKLVIPTSKSLGKARLQYLSIALEPEITDQHKALTLETTAALDVQIGPMKASIDQIGFKLELDFDAPRKNLGCADLEVGFKPPTGIGLVIDAKAVKGGGFLFLDAPQGQYAGVIQLETAGGLAIKAIGLLNTKLPNGAPGFSLLVIITAEGFKPVPLGYGFYLTGLGGLLGINRTINSPALEAGIFNSTLDAILFPKDPVRNAPQYLNALRTVFPPRNDRHLFGPMAQIIWGGSPLAPLLTIKLALLLEFSTDFNLKKFGMLAQLSAKLPSPTNAIVRLNMNARGELDFEQEKASLDAALYDSRFAEKFVLTGAMAMRLRWGKDPSFALSVGGFHPAFTVPSDFPKLPRVGLAFANEENLKLICEAYFAITSNTVQFGARAYLFAKKFGFSVEGDIGYDVLIQFDPFHFLAGFHASLQLKRGSTNLFKVKLEGEIEGPRPLKVRGKATFEILWWDYSVSFDRTLVSGEKPPLPAPVNILPLIKQALNEPSSWQATLPPSTTKIATFRESARPGEIMAHPLGTLSVKQNVVPLKLRVTRFGHTRPTEVQSYAIQKVVLGDQVEPSQRDIHDFFAPAQFREMSDDEKLSSPSFEKFSAGLQFGSERVTTGVALAADLSYEETVFAPAGTKPKSSHQPDENLLALFGHLSAAARPEIRQQGQNKYQAKTIAFTATEKVYQLVSITDTAQAAKLPDTTSTEFRTWAEANAAIWQARQNLRVEAQTVQIISTVKGKANA